MGAVVVPKPASNLSTETSSSSVKVLLTTRRFTDYTISMAYLDADDNETKRYVLAVCEAKYVAVALGEDALERAQREMDATLPQLMEQMQLALRRNSDQKYITGILLVNDYIRFLAFWRKDVPELDVAELLAGRLPPPSSVLNAVERKAVVNSELCHIVDAEILQNGKRSVSYSRQFKTCWNQYIIAPSSDPKKFPM